MSVTEMYDILNLITNAQEEEHYVLGFNINNEIVTNLISSYAAVPDDIVEVADPPPTNKKSRAKPRKKTFDSSDSKSDSSTGIGSVPDFSPPSVLRTNLSVNEVSSTFSPIRVVATPTFPTVTEQQVETESLHILPEHTIVSALHAVAAHNSKSSIESPTNGASESPNTMPLDPKTIAVPNTSPNFRSRQKRPRINTDSEQLESKPNESESESSGGRAIKRVRLPELPEQPNDLDISLSPPTVTVASAIAIPMTKTKETARARAKRGLKSKAPAIRATTSSRPKTSVDSDERKEKQPEKLAAKSSKPPPPPRQASKRYAK